jgi:hypothetical protein
MAAITPPISLVCASAAAGSYRLARAAGRLRRPQADVSEGGRDVTERERRRYRPEARATRGDDAVRGLAYFHGVRRSLRHIQQFQLDLFVGVLNRHRALFALLFRARRRLD